MNENMEFPDISGDDIEWLQEQFVQAGHPELAALVVTDTQPVVPYVSNDLVHRFNGINKAVPYSGKNSKLLHLA